MIRPMHILPDLVGKIAHLHPMAAKYDPKDSYSINKYDQLLFFQNVHDCRMFFRFINESPYFTFNTWHYCLEDSELKDWYWFTLNQLIICTD